jgi:hypothetical protein
VAPATALGKGGGAGKNLNRRAPPLIDVENSFHRGRSVLKAVAGATALQSASRETRSGVLLVRTSDDRPIISGEALWSAVAPATALGGWGAGKNLNRRGSPLIDVENSFHRGYSPLKAVAGATALQSASREMRSGVLSSCAQAMIVPSFRAKPFGVRWRQPPLWKGGEEPARIRIGARRLSSM